MTTVVDEQARTTHSLINRQIKLILLPNNELTYNMTRRQIKPEHL